jgi:hypothetical protein
MKTSDWLARRILLSRFASVYVIAIVLAATFANEYLNDTLRLQDGEIPRYLSVRLKPSRELLLRGGGRTLLHAGFEDGFFGSGMDFGPLVLGDAFTIEVRGTPRRRETSPADLVGNHPGRNHHEGFVVEQDADMNGVYYFTCANGQRWLPSVSFSLPPGCQFYLAVLVERSRISIFRNGVLLVASDMGDVMKNSDLPLSVGNWVNRDHRFNGTIDEVRITEGALSPDLIRLNAQHLGLLIQDGKRVDTSM